MTGSHIRRLAGLVAAVALTLGWLGGRAPLWERDEPRFALAAHSVAMSGAWAAPRVLGVARHQKPPLATWLMAACIRAVGWSERSVRLPSALAAAAAVGATAAWVGAHASPGVAWWAAVMLASSPLLWVEGLLATADALLLALGTALLAGLPIRPGAPRRPARGLMASVISVAAWLTKSIAGLVPVLVLAVTAVASRQPWPTRLRNLAVPAALAIAGAAALGAWLTLASVGTGEPLWRTHVTREIVARIVGDVDGHGARAVTALGVYTATVLFGFSPWSLLVVAAPRRAFDVLAQAPACLAAILVPLAVCAVPRTVLPHYLLLAWPGLSWLAAATAASVADHPREAGIVGRRVVRWLVLAGSLEITALLAAGWLELPGPSTGALYVQAALVAALVVLPAPSLWRGALPRAITTLAATTGIALAWLAGAVLPDIAATQATVRASRSLASIADDGQSACLGHDVEAGVAIDSPGRAWTRLPDRSSYDHCSLLVIDGADRGAPLSAGWAVIGLHKGRDLVHGRTQEIRILRRGRPGPQP